MNESRLFVVKEIDSIFHGVYCNQDIIIDTSISIVPSLFINEFIFTDHILYAGSLMTSQYNMILILLFLLACVSSVFVKVNYKIVSLEE